MTENTAIIKIGGAPARDDSALELLAAEILTLSSRNRIAVVHGGGAEVTSLAKQLGIEPVFEDGVRMTGDKEMPIVDMVLCGLVNTRVVRTLNRAGVRAVGLSGADADLLVGKPVTAAGGESRTATIERVNPGILRTLWDGKYVPVIASPGSDSGRRAVNINADEAAFGIASAVKADVVVFLSDVAGVLASGGEPIASLSLEQANLLMKAGTITGGMTAKIRSAAAVIESGVRSVVIGMHTHAGDLEKLITGQTGTVVGDKR